MIQDRTIVIKKLVHDLYNGAIFNDLEWPLIVVQRHDIIQRQITRKSYKIELYLQWQVDTKLYIFCETAPSSIILNDLTTLTHISSHAIIRRCPTEHLRKGTRYRQIYNGSLIGSYTFPTQECYFEWPWMTGVTLARYSMTQSIAQPLCDSWASCSRLCQINWNFTHCEVCRFIFYKLS